jgi:hypothetical protein
MTPTGCWSAAYVLDIEGNISSRKTRIDKSARRLLHEGAIEFIDSAGLSIGGIEQVARRVHGQSGVDGARCCRHDSRGVVRRAICVHWIPCGDCAIQISENEKRGPVLPMSKDTPAGFVAAAGFETWPVGPTIIPAPGGKPAKLVTGTPVLPVTENRLEPPAPWSEIQNSLLQ